MTPADKHGHQLNPITVDASAPANPDISVFIENIDEAYASAMAANVEIVHPPTVEDWGVTRFFYRDCSAQVINVGAHS